MTLTRSTTKSHGPCDICGNNIGVGVQMITTTRDATKEDYDKKVKTFQIPGIPWVKVSIKVHRDCKELYVWRNGRWHPKRRPSSTN